MTDGAAPIVVRAARGADELAIVRIVRPDARLGPLRRLAIRLAASPTANSTLVAVSDGKIVGALRGGFGGKERASLVAKVVRSVAFEGIVDTLRGLRTRTEGYRSRLHVPAGSYEVRDVQVAETLRGHGIGDALLREAEAVARASGSGQLALLVRADNPARRLYERHGYEVIYQQPDGGPPGAPRLLMTKVL